MMIKMYNDIEFDRQTFLKQRLKCAQSWLLFVRVQEERFSVSYYFNIFATL